MGIITENTIQLNGLQAQLSHAEDSIERAARNAWMEWGAQLKYIRDNRLHVAHAMGCTWEQYTQDRWEMTPQRAGQLITAYEQVKQIETFVSESETICLPSSESHVRPLLALDKPEQRAAVWQRVLETANGKVTARIVGAEVERFKAEKEKNWLTLDEWKELSASEQHRRLTQIGGHHKTFNETNDNVEWALWTWNPVTGCLHDCAYCYARDIADRFYAQKFQPSIIPERLSMPANTKQPNLDAIEEPVKRMGLKNVFTCSMADLFGKWVPDEWINAVLEQVRNNPQWNFLFLTKFPIRMAEFEYPDNAWIGTTVDRQWAVERAEKAFSKVRATGYNGIAWLSCEPMMERLEFSKLDMFDWLVMGGSSKSTQTPAFMPPIEWTFNLWNQAKTYGLPIYMKTNLGIENDIRLREYPKRAQS